MWLLVNPGLGLESEERKMLGLIVRKMGNCCGPGLDCMKDHVKPISTTAQFSLQFELFVSVLGMDRPFMYITPRFLEFPKRKIMPQSVVWVWLGNIDWSDSFWGYIFHGVLQLIWLYLRSSVLAYWQNRVTMNSRFTCLLTTWQLKKKVINRDMKAMNENSCPFHVLLTKVKLQ